MTTLHPRDDWERALMMQAAKSAFWAGFALGAACMLWFVACAILLRSA